MNKELLRVTLSQRALLLPAGDGSVPLTAATAAFVRELSELGYVLSEPALRAVNSLDDDDRQTLLDAFNDVMGTRLNWAALVRGWLTPTGESVWDHFVTLIANTLKDETDISGTTLPCGHLIPDGTFPLERYTGCPFCGRPFTTADVTFRGQGKTKKMLSLWSQADLEAFFNSLLIAPVPPDATQREAMKVLLSHLPLPADVTITMKETLAIVVDELVNQGRDSEAGRLFTSPTDVMRYLWYRHTGQTQLVQPRTLISKAERNHRHRRATAEELSARRTEEQQKLRLKYDRRWCLRVARWLNALPQNLDTQLEAMHPRREMWVRFIRALRLHEYARRPEMTQLRMLLDRFYRHDYSVLQGLLDRHRLSNDGEATLRMLQQRPGLFARSLFSTMLWFGPDRVITAFREVMDSVAPRLLLTLGTHAQLYFDRDAQRLARPLSGSLRPIPPHTLLVHYSDDDLHHMQQLVSDLYLDAMRQHFQSQNYPPSTINHQPFTIHIAPELYQIPVSVGDRSATIQDTSCALQGQRFAVEGDDVRLFLQWGRDLPAQPLDMDLSCFILTDSEADTCAYFNLVTEGAKHSGDIRQIPDMVGTAEYVELSIPQLKSRGARRVVFTCNAYTSGALQPNLVVGWMTADKPMAVSEETGVAYDPSTVQHMVRISTSNLSKGLVFGVLDVDRREITWLEVPFDGQTVLNITPQTIDAYLRRMQAKPTIGQLLDIKAEAQGLKKTDSPDAADECYTLLWAQNAAAVASLLLA